MKNLTVGKRIILGFASLILIAVALGAVAIVQMSGVEKGSERLANAYVPEVEVANNIERNLMMTMYANRGYASTEDNALYEEARAGLAKTVEHLDASRVLAQTQNLPGLAKAEPEVRAEIEKYSTLTTDTKVTIGQLQGFRVSMDENAAAFVKAANALIAEHEAATATALEERTLKVTKTEEVMDHGSNARILNMRAQASGDLALFDQALERLDDASEALEVMRPITRSPEDIAIFTTVEKAIAGYGNAIKGFAAETRKGAAANAATLESLRESMDRNAGIFAEQVDEFFSGQVTKMNENITDRIQMMAWVNDVIDLGNAARVNNFKSQALSEPPFMLQAMERIDSMDPIFAELEAKTETAENRANLAAVKQTAAGYRQAMDNYLQGFYEMQRLGQQRNDVGIEALEQAQQLAFLGMEETREIADESVASLGAAGKIMVVGLVIAAALGVFLAVMITRSITGPLTRAIADLSNGSSESSSAAGQVSSASQSLAEGASEQASSLEETSSSMEEITSMVAQNADIAKQTSEHARQASDAAGEGVRSMSELRSGADAVNASAKEMEEAMGAIKESSDSISKIIKTIDEIAFQTNILALNAAVEAARAGEAGAGFAVVADEVRSLAHRAAEAAQETAVLIEGSMQRSDRGVQVNKMVGENVLAVLTKAEMVEQGLKTISDTVGEVAGSMQGLEASVAEQQEGIGQINIAITQVNDVTQSNAASAEEAASAAEEMNAQAVSLMEIVGTLTLMVNGTKPDAAGSPSTRSSGGFSGGGSDHGFSLPGD